MDRARRARSGRVPQTDSSLRGGPKLEPVPKLGTLSQTGGPAHGRGAPDNACALQRHLLDRTEVAPNYWAMPVVSWPAVCHSFQNFGSLHRYQYLPVVGNGTSYVLFENVRFFEPFSYGSSCSGVHQPQLNALASAPLCVPTMIVL